MILRVLGKLICIVIIVTFLSIFMLMILYTPVREGKIYLNQAYGSATLLREDVTAIHHIDADSLEMALYT